MDSATREYIGYVLGSVLVGLFVLWFLGESVGFWFMLGWIGHGIFVNTQLYLERKCWYAGGEKGGVK